MLAFGMNGERMPLPAGFPVRLIAPGWHSPYCVKMLNDIEVLAAPDDGYWMAKADKIPDTPRANVRPGEKDFPAVPINRSIPLGGMAMGGDCGGSGGSG